MLEIGEPRLNLITAISNSDQEEKIAALLHSQGCNIIYRALNIDLLTTFLVSNHLKVGEIFGLIVLAIPDCLDPLLLESI